MSEVFEKATREEASMAGARWVRERRGEVRNEHTLETYNPDSQTQGSMNKFRESLN